MDDLKLYDKTMQELYSLVQTARIDIRMQFEIAKCAMLEMKRRKVVQSEEIELLSGETIKSLEDEKGYKYVGVLQFDSVKCKEMKDIITKEYYRNSRKIKSLNAGNSIKAINAIAVSVIRYRAGIVAWRINELEAIDRKTRQLLTMYRSLHPRTDVDRLYWKRINGGKGVDKS